ncbi:unnamed protein product [Urochloa decumbens]|uniref:Peptidase A1 domain-containing protein n=1 Tax=Urochloa decumbens TaxID=240449 RepID=A0ABC9DYG0_9POAL
MASVMPLALLLLVLLVTQTNGSRRVLLPSTDDDSGGGSPSSNACPSILSGHNKGNKLPVIHRLSPCSPLGGGIPKHGKAALHEILDHDGLRMRYIYEIQASGVAAAAPAPSAMPPSGVSIPATQNVISSLPGVFSYTVLAGYGTPAQQLPLYFDVSGMSNLRCKPCFSSGSGAGAAQCDRAFDPSVSSSFRTVPCESPDCRETSCSSGSSCTFTFYNSTFVFGHGTVVTDTLTLSPSATFEDFSVGCMQLDNMFSDGAAAGNIDLSRSRHSLTTRVLLSSPPGTAAFSYCLPADTDTHGFLSIAPALADYSGNAGVKYVPLVTNPRGPNFYFVDLVAIAINGTDLPVPSATFRGNGTMIDSQSAFTYLNPPIYTALRDEFRRAMEKYQLVPAFSDLDTCYNFTGFNYIELPDITLKFGNGETMELDDRQFMYFFREHLDDGFPFGCLAFAATQDPSFAWNLLGSQVQRTKEIVYDVHGSKVAFVPSRCGLR